MSTQISLQDAVAAPRSHAEILRSIGAQNIRKALELEGLDVPKPSGVQQWVQRDSIPGEYWNSLARAGFATLEELAAYAETKKVVAAAAVAVAIADAIADGVISGTRSTARDTQAPAHFPAAPDQ